MFQKNKMIVDEIYPDAVFGRVACNCGCSDCDIAFVIEENDLGVYSMNLYKDISAFSNDKGWKQAWWRIKNAAKILATGRVKAHADFILDEANLDAFEDLIQETHHRIALSKRKNEDGNN